MAARQWSPSRRKNSVAVTCVDAVSVELLNAQLAALAQDMPPQTIKTGLLGSVENLRVVCRWVDHVRDLALRLGAYGVHLGQEDLDMVDLHTLRQAGVRLGISTHSYWEVARAWGLRPSYIACSPIFATQSKDMPWIPQGLDNLRYWASLLPMPVVGIAGIDVGNIAEVAAQGVASAAVITAITRAPNAEDACRQLQAEFARGQERLHTGVPVRAKPTL